MILKKKEFKLIKIYMYICDLYVSELKYYSERHSNNMTPSFTDQEIISIYLFLGSCQIYIFFLFTLLTSYHTFNLRLNRLNEAFKVLFKRFIDSSISDNCDYDISLVDSMLIITFGGSNRDAEVARELVPKGFYSKEPVLFWS